MNATTHEKLPLDHFQPISLHGARGERQIVKGRCIYDGYQRALSLQYGKLSEKLAENELYVKARNSIGATASGPRSVVHPHKRENMFILITNYFREIEHHNIIEFGAYAGGNAIFLATTLKQFYPGAKVFALDTYEGIPSPDNNRDMVEEGRFSPEGGVESIREYADSLGLNNIEFVKGLFQDTLPDLISAGVKFGLAHMDADHYGAINFAQDTVWPAMTRGGYLTYDDPLDSSCMGAMEAMEDFMFSKGIHTEQMYPHPVLRAHL